jgi:hypothetical protein
LKVFENFWREFMLRNWRWSSRTRLIEWDGWLHIMGNTIITKCYAINFGFRLSVPGSAAKTKWSPYRMDTGTNIGRLGNRSISDFDEVGWSDFEPYLNCRSAPLEGRGRANVESRRGLMWHLASIGCPLILYPNLRLIW